MMLKKRINSGVVLKNCKIAILLWKNAQPIYLFYKSCYINSSLQKAIKPGL